MLTVTVSASLASFLPPAGGNLGHAPVLRFDAGDWAGIADELRTRFPRLAAHMLADDGSVRKGFLVAVNDEVSNRRLPRVRSGDEVFLLVQIAGG